MVLTTEQANALTPEQYDAMPYLVLDRGGNVVRSYEPDQAELARRCRDRLDSRYGASVHTLARYKITL